MPPADPFSEQEPRPDGDPAHRSAASVETEAAPPRAPRRWLLGMSFALLLAALLFSKPARNFWSQTMATYYGERASQKRFDGDFAAALQDADRALSWLPDSPQLHFLRARIYEEDQQLDASRADYDAAIEQAEKFTAAYQRRATVLGRLGRPREALADLDRAVALSPDDDPVPLNHRAYLRALHNLELDQALADVERAIEIEGKPNASFLDTRGFIYYLQGNTAAARADLQRAIELLQEEIGTMRQSPGFKQASDRERKVLERQWNEGLAVMIQHRGLVHRRLGNDLQAEADQEEAERLGFDPERGVE